MDSGKIVVELLEFQEECTIGDVPIPMPIPILAPVERRFRHWMFPNLLMQCTSEVRHVAERISRRTDVPIFETDLICRDD